MLLHNGHFSVSPISQFISLVTCCLFARLLLRKVVSADLPCSSSLDRVPLLSTLGSQNLEVLHF